MPRRRALGIARRRSVSGTDAHRTAVEHDDVVDLQLTSTAALDLAVDRHEPVDDGLFDVTTRVEHAGELQKLSETDAVSADRNIHRRRSSHAEMLAEAR